MSRMVSKMLAPITRRLRLMIARGTVQIVNDSLKCQGLQVVLLADEVQDDVERFQEYGFTSVPFADSEALFLSVGGNRSHGVVVCVNDRTRRPKDMAEGDVCLHNSKGELVYINEADDIVHLGAKSAADFIALAADVDSRITTIQSAFDSHIHITTATIGPSAAPGVITAPTAPIGGLSSVAATKVKAT